MKGDSSNGPGVGREVIKVQNLFVSYGEVPILSDISIEIGLKEIVCVIGANGAGKTTLLRAISGVLPVKRGQVYLEGKEITHLAAHRIARMGISHVPEGRQIFMSLTVLDNLLLGMYVLRGRGEKENLSGNIDRVFDIFQVLKGRQNQMAGTLSGGEQQMLALGRALVSEPKVILLDEPSMGLAPMVVKEIFGVIARLSKGGIPVLLVDQNAKAVLGISDRGYLMELGKVVLEGTSGLLSGSERVRVAYLGRRSVGTAN